MKRNNGVDSRRGIASGSRKVRAMGCGQMLAAAVLVAGAAFGSSAFGSELGAAAQKTAAAATFSCGTSATGIAYCTYRGPVQMTYVNDNRLILLYPAPAITPTLIQSQVEASGYEAYWGIDISQFIAFGAEMPAASDPDFTRKADFADKFYGMCLAAQLTGRVVNLQMRGGHFGYLRIDRAWLE